MIKCAHLSGKCYFKKTFLIRNIANLFHENITLLLWYIRRTCGTVCTDDKFIRNSINHYLSSPEPVHPVCSGRMTVLSDRPHKCKYLASHTDLK
jgi:hypothetical protein